MQLVGTIRRTIRPGEQAFRERRKDVADDLAYRLGGADVLLGHLERAVTRALLDLERVVASDSHPREARAAQVLKAHVLARCVRLEELGAFHPRRPQMLSQIGGPPLLKAEGDDRALAARLCVHRAEQWQQGRLDRETADAPVAGLGLLQALGIAVERAAHRNDAALHVDVTPRQRLEFASSNEQIGAERVGAPLLERHLLGREQSKHLIGIQPLELLGVIEIRRRNAERWVVGTNS